MKKILLLPILGLLLIHPAMAEKESVGKKAEQGVEKGGNAAGRGIEKGLDATGRGLKKGADAAGRGVKKGLEATGKGLEKAGSWLEREMHKSDKSDKK
jgi:hypothetical protein